jgi:hypothetical protein
MRKKKTPAGSCELAGVFVLIGARECGDTEPRTVVSGIKRDVAQRILYPARYRSRFCNTTSLAASVLSTLSS